MQDSRIRRYIKISSQLGLFTLKALEIFLNLIQIPIRLLLWVEMLII
jgi:hypothetical protein